MALYLPPFQRCGSFVPLYSRHRFDQTVCVITSKAALQTVVVSVLEGASKQSYVTLYNTISLAAALCGLALQSTPSQRPWQAVEFVCCYLLLRSIYRYIQYKIKSKTTYDYRYKQIKTKAAEEQNTTRRTPTTST